MNAIADPAVSDLGFSAPDSRRNVFLAQLPKVLVTIISVLLAFGISGVLIWQQGVNPFYAYWILFSDTWGNPAGLLRVMQKSTPLVLTGLAVTVGLRAGLFNIGVQGQLLVAAIGAAWAGYFFSLPSVIHIPVALIFGMLCGGAWASIAGVLRASRRVSEVITTIMLNSIAIALVDWLASRPMKEPDQPLSRTPLIAETAVLPQISVIPAGFLLAVVIALVVGWTLTRTTVGFSLNTVGLNGNAARYAGMSVKTTLAMAMVVSGALAGLGGAIETLGVTGRFESAFNIGLGFDGITIALLSRANPIAAIPAAVMVGTLRAGSVALQFDTGLAPEIVDVILALILLFVAAPIVSRLIRRRRGHLSLAKGLAL